MARTLDDLAAPRGRAGTWVAGARPRTLAASLAPVAVGTAAASTDGHIAWHRAILALVVAVGIQVAANYANDAADGARGADAVRVGPVRLVAAGLATPGRVLTAAACSAGVGCLAGLALAAETGWWLLAVGGCCLVAGYCYVGGPRPYGYAGFGELAAFVFFGPVAVVGTAWVAAAQPHVSGVAAVASVGVGLLAVALLVANNLRDRATDAAAGKRTLAVLLGDHRTRAVYAASVVLPAGVAAALAPWHPGALLALLALAVAARPMRRVLGGDSGRVLVASLLDTARVQLAYGVLLTLGLALS